MSRSSLQHDDITLPGAACSMLHLAGHPCQRGGGGAFFVCPTIMSMSRESLYLALSVLLSLACWFEYGEQLELLMRMLCQMLPSPGSKGTAMVDTGLVADSL
eukprot:2821143-Amphidinium_carterae.1